ncbi:hypothetical protein HYPSUDRAFT_76870 [Hypholoma sublateritium FD-334 SS-4]|uniref:F-box domain-containing protein n=1 Tax=Hypholoma sublateritium (strain FD-334 SS-4) TaxID=945553 RepID=A0A0D2P465_HYPSF|nr:hypothetical protein HYPSUDRAFT_76870 [Hypholoma sublateritium FD-334 SS-4]
MVFGNLDLMEIVFDAFPISHHYSHSRKKLLLWAALTSKDFLDPAMNVLWRSLNSISPILDLIPIPENWTATNEDLSKMDVVSVKDLITQRADQYRRRVRHLTLTDLDEEHTNIADYIDIFNRFPPEFRLLPCLRSFTAIDLNEFGWEHLQGLCRIPSPTLSKVDLIGVGGSELHVETFLARLSRMKPGSLVTLTMRVLQRQLIENCLQVLQQFSSLSRLSLVLAVGHKADRAVEILTKAVARVLTLRDLTLECSCDRRRNLVIPSTVFPTELPLLDKLERLKVVGSSVFVCAVVGAISKHIPNLKALSLETWVSSEDQNLAMFEHCFTNAVTHFASVEWFVLDVDTEDSPFHWNALGFIRKWKSLKHLDIFAPTVVVDRNGDQPLSDLLVRLPDGLDSLECLRLDVRYWTQLEQLCLATKYMFLSFPRIAECCPRLLSLEIYVPFPIDPVELEIMERALILDVDPDPEHALVPSGAMSHGLEWLIFRQPIRTELVIHKPSLESAMVVGRYLAVVFPQLKYVDFNGIVPFVGKGWCNTVAGITGAHEHNWRD